MGWRRLRRSRLLGDLSPRGLCAVDAPVCGDGACAEWREPALNCPEDCNP